jgi:hypothetical protein
MSKKSTVPKRSAPPAAPTPGRTLYVNAPDGVLSEIDDLLAADPLSRARFLGKLLEMGLEAYKREKGLTS